uniref:NADH-ubiquinone oxidoreductase chain 4L n=1 Tax=Phyllodactylus unctus TaxID=611294 RepID=K9JVN8_9SAUR|nr:NADH dehydrogenase subunit 4L [Phyllodactylus unctus]ADY86064.1 NADH dehydrogenase subunit 4L [Phyllodactylus unctus]
MALLHFTLLATFTLSLLGLSLHRHQLVSALLCLEGLTLTLFLALAQNLHSTTTSPTPIILLAIGSCEAGAGLALLVASTRTHATNLLKSLSLLKC